MSNTTTKRLVRWAATSSLIALLLFLLSGQWTSPWLWAYVSVCSAAGLYAALTLTDDLARERFKPPSAGADKGSLRIIRVVALVHVVAGTIDAGRMHWTTVPDGARAVGLAAMALGVWLVFHAMHVNHFFSAVVRIQSDRDHHVIDRGPYALVRHPGYVGMILAVPGGALVIGSWIGFAIALVYALLMIRRATFEDGFLRSNLNGYASYAARVRYRLMPGIW
jgi:protein-S-isoprenylcysteine O-methyltransferase Ste14